MVSKMHLTDEDAERIMEALELLEWDLLKREAETDSCYIMDKLEEEWAKAKVLRFWIKDSINRSGATLVIEADY